MREMQGDCQPDSRMQLENESCRAGLHGGTGEQPCLSVRMAISPDSHALYMLRDGLGKQDPWTSETGSELAVE